MTTALRRFLFPALPVLCGLLLLTGCPWGGMHYYPDETASITVKNNALCFFIPAAKDYQPVFVAVNPKNTPPKERQFTRRPELRVTDGQLCIPPSVYHLPGTSVQPLIINVVLKSQTRNHRPRSFVMGFEMRDGKAYDVALTDREINLPSADRHKR